MKKIVILLLVILCGCSSIDVSSTKEATNYFKEEKGYLYHYNKLSENDQKIYQDIYNCMYDHGHYVDIDLVDEKDFDRIFYAIIEDNPEIFYVTSYSYTTYDDYTRFQPLYGINEKQIKNYNSDLKIITNNIINDTKNYSDYDKVKYVYDYVISNCAYNEEAKYNQEIISSMINKSSVCSGYAKMVQYILEKLNIKCTFISGVAKKVDTGENPNHAWNMIYINNDYYYIDSTWGDVETDGTPYTLYSYFMFNSDDMLKLYQPSNDYEITSTNNDAYFVKTGSYFDSYNFNGLIKCLKNNVHDNSIELKFSNSCYNNAVNQLIDSQSFYAIANRAGYDISEISYVNNDILKTIYIKW